MGGRRYHLPRHSTQTRQPGARCSIITCISSRYRAPKRYTMQACLGDRGRWAPKSYLPGPILYCPGAQGAQGLRCVASEGVFVHSSISVPCPLALRARRFPWGSSPRLVIPHFQYQCSVSWRLERAGSGPGGVNTVALMLTGAAPWPPDGRASRSH